jgi:hypothetical protein
MRTAQAILSPLLDDSAALSASGLSASTGYAAVDCAGCKINGNDDANAAPGCPAKQRAFSGAAFH